MSDMSFDSSVTSGSPDSQTHSVSGLVQWVSQFGSAQHTTYQYDAFGRVIRSVNPLGGVERTGYNALGQVSQTVDHEGNTTRYSYYPANHANAGQLAGKTNPEGETVSYTYNTRGQVTEV